MIARDSKSYPYLAIAQHYGVSYWKVLRVSYYYEKCFASPLNSMPPFQDWKFAIWKLEKDKVHCNIK